MNFFEKLFLTNRIYPVELAIFDVIHPKMPVGGFRHAEHSYYFENFANIICFHGHSYKPQTKKEIRKAIHEYCQFLEKPEWEKRFYLLDEVKKLRPELAYSLMIEFTLKFLPTFEKFKIPFCICVTPGGGFCIDNEISDDKCKRIIESPSFRYLIATQEIINDYLINKIPSLKGKSEVIYGGFSQVELKEVPSREDVCKKKHLDIAFIAYNYGNKGFDKGFDLFCEVITKLAVNSDHPFRFHIIGNWDSNNIDFAPKPSKDIIYHGVLQQERLLDIYPKIDIIINPYRLLQSGSFNGFPMSPDGSMCGAALFTTNPLNLKTPYISGIDVVEITTDSSEIVKKVLFYEKNRNLLKFLAKKGQEKTHKFRSRQIQAEARTKIFEKLLNHKLSRI